MARGRSIIGSLPTDGNPQAPQPPADPEPKQGAKAQKGKSTSIIGSLPTAGGGPAAPTPAAQAPAPAPLPPAPSPLAPAPAASKPKGRKRKSDSLIGDLPGDQASPSTPAQAQPAAQTKKPKAAKSGSLIGSLPEPQEAKPPPAPAPVPLPAAQTQPPTAPKGSSLIGSLPVPQGIPAPPAAAPPTTVSAAERTEVENQAAYVPMPADIAPEPTPHRSADPASSSIIGALVERAAPSPNDTGTFAGLPTAERATVHEHHDSARGFRLIVRKRNDGPRPQRAVHSFTYRQDLRVGGMTDCDVYLPEATGAVTLGVGPGSIALVKIDAPAGILLNGHQPLALPAPLKNGDELIWGAYSVRLAIQLQQVDGENRSRSLVGRLTVLLVCAALAWQFAMVGGLTWVIFDRMELGHEIARARLVHRIDDIKGKIATSELDQEDVRQAMLLEAMRGELKHITGYLREYRSDLSDRQVADFNRQLAGLQTVLEDLDADTFGYLPAVQARPYLERLLRSE